MLKVGYDKVPATNNSTREFKPLDYTGVEYDKDGLADASKYIPSDYDLVYLKTNFGNIKNGWWAGNEFFCRKLLDGEKVLKWKKNKDMI